MNTPPLPDIPGVQQLTPLEMNSLHFDKRHTVLSPQVLGQLKKPQSGSEAVPADSTIQQKSPKVQK